MNRYGGGQIHGDQPEVLLVELVKTCESCPAQWEGRLIDGSSFYARARHGRFTVTVSKGDRPDPSAPALVHGTMTLVSQFTLGYEIEDEPNTAEMLKMCGADLVSPAFYGQDAISRECVAGAGVR